MFTKNEWKKLSLLIGCFIFLFYLPIGYTRFDNAILEALHLVKWYAREHVLLCLLPAFFISGAIAVFIGKDSVMKYLGAKANKVLAYGVASISGTILAICSCTVLPLFAGIYRMGAGLGPATAFLYSGPAINVLAILLTARVLGMELGIARAVGAILFSIVIGLCMHMIFRKEEQNKIEPQNLNTDDDKDSLSILQNLIYFISMIGILVFANWGAPENEKSIWTEIYQQKWAITSFFSIVLSFVLIAWLKVKWHKVTLAAIPSIALGILFHNMPLIPFAAGIVGLSIITATGNKRTHEWFSSSWDFAKQIFPLLFIGILIAGILLGRVGHEGLIPSQWISKVLGDNSFSANFFASFAGAFMYFATLTEIPILQGLINNGMGKGPALALLLAGPALSLPNMLVIRSVLGTIKTMVFIFLVVVMATLSGMIFGHFFD